MGLRDVFQIEPLLGAEMLVLAALPTAPASYVMARQLGGDYQLMASIITVQTLLATAITLLILLVLG